MPTKLKRVAVVAAFGLVAAVLTGGCSGPPRAKVKGTVTIDGKPLTDGSIEFFPVGAGQTAGTAIHDGAYQVEASPGEMKVSIHGIEVVGQRKAYDTPDSPMIDITRNPISAKYNTNSELRANLMPGPNEVNFELKGESKK